MARIQTPQHPQELQAEFKVRGPFGLELLETIQPTYQLGRQKIASVGYPLKAIGIVSGAAGGAGTNTEAVLTCPAELGIIILLEQILIRNTAGTVSLRIWQGDPLASVQTTFLRKAFRDTRIVDSLPQGIIQSAIPLTAAANGLQVGSISSVADDTVIIEPEVVLGSGGFFLVREDTADAALEVTFMWTEFLLEDR